MNLKQEDILHWLTPEQEPVKDFIAEQAAEIERLETDLAMYKSEVKNSERTGQ